MGPDPHRLHRFFGAQVARGGVTFRLWAPKARAVFVVCDGFEPHPLAEIDGVWQGTLASVPLGARYFYDVTGEDGVVRRKADPYAQAAELRPGQASRVFASHHTWSDADYRRGRTDPRAGPMCIYEAHLGSFRRGQQGWLGYRDLDPLIDHVLDLGFTHLELMPLMEHPYDGSWGYQVSGYFAPTARHGGPDDLRWFVDRCHRRGLGVIFDWVPAHFPKDAFALSRFDGTALYEHADPRRGDHRQWGTHVFDYGKAEVRDFLISSAIFWLEEMHGDGLRCDAVASMIYLDYAASHPDQWVENAFGGREHLEAIAFLRALCEAVHAEVPHALMIAEDSSAWPGVTHPAQAGGLGFDLKWNLGFMHDTLSYFARDPIERKHHHDRVTFGLSYGFDERFILPLSHDEVVHEKRSLLGKMPGDRWQRFANLRALYGHMWAHPGKKLLFMGGELGMEREWSEARALDWDLLDDPQHRGLMHLLRDLNRLYQGRPALHRFDHVHDGFRWIDVADADRSTFAYLRLGEPAEVSPERRDHLVCVENFTPVVRHNHRVGVPASTYREVLNTDDRRYGGSGVNNPGLLEAVSVPAHGFSHSLELTLPPLGVVYLAPS